METNKNTINNNFAILSILIRACALKSCISCSVEKALWIARMHLFIAFVNHSKLCHAMVKKSGYIFEPSLFKTDINAQFPLTFRLYS